jgi:septal ring factor EnvC (AmiA/AmiB activator)
VRCASAFLAIALFARTGEAQPGPRAALAEQLAAELQILDRTLVTIDDKLVLADATRLRRVRAAYRILRAPLPADASAGDRMASARRRAAARILLERDREERQLLAGELDQLHAARTQTLAAARLAPAVALPESLAMPARGTIARRFGTLVHERSKAVLSRRGIDLDVKPLAPVVAPEAGIVRYAGAIRGLDHGVVLDHGAYYTIVAKLAELAIPVGTRVERGDRIGRAARQRVYLEVRAKIGPGGLPIDPEPLLAR